MRKLHSDFNIQGWSFFLAHLQKSVSHAFSYTFRWQIHATATFSLNAEMSLDYEYIVTSHLILLHTECSTSGVPNFRINKSFWAKKYYIKCMFNYQPLHGYENFNFSRHWAILHNCSLLIMYKKLWDYHKGNRFWFATCRIVHTEGWRSFWRGISATQLKIDVLCYHLIKTDFLLPHCNISTQINVNDSVT